MPDNELDYYASMMLTEREYVQKQYTLNITEILGPENYFKIFETLRNSSEVDLIELRLSSNGGRLDSGMILYSIIKENFKKRSISYIDSSAASMAGLLFLACDERIIYPHSVLMIHDMSVGIDGKANEIINHVNAYEESFQVLYNKICKTILTEKEHELISNGVDLFLSARAMCEKGIAHFVIYEGERMTAAEYLKELENE